MTANSMRGRWIAGLLWLTVAWPVCAESVVFWVTPTNLDGGGQFVFAVTNSPGSDGLSFHVTITPKKGEVPANSEAHLCSARIETNSRSFGPLTQETRVALKRSRHTWEADFVTSKELVSQPDTCFVFTAWDPRSPAADFYMLRLRDFIALASAAASDFIIKQKDLTGPTGRPQRFSLSVHKMARLHMGGEPNRVLELSVADAAAEANSVKLWAAGVYENDAFPPTRWIADIADTEDQSRKLVLVVQAKTCFASLEIYQVDMSRPGLTNQSADELLKDNPAPIATLKFQYSNTLRELISADLSPKGRRVEIDGVSQQVGGVRTGPDEPFMLTFNRQTGHWDIPADFAEKIKLTSRVPPSLYSSAVAEDLRVKLQSGGPEQKERALEAIMALGAVRLLPEAIGAIEDPTPLPRHGDTGWGFVGHEAATVVGTSVNSRRRWS